MIHQFATLFNSNHNSLKCKLLPREYTHPKRSLKRFHGRNDRPLKLLLRRLRYAGTQGLRARIVHVIPLVGLAFLKKTAGEPICTARSLPMGRDSLGTGMRERGASVEGKDTNDERRTFFEISGGKGQNVLVKTQSRSSRLRALCILIPPAAGN